MTLSTVHPRHIYHKPAGEGITRSRLTASSRRLGIGFVPRLVLFQSSESFAVPLTITLSSESSCVYQVSWLGETRLMQVLRALASRTKGKMLPCCPAYA
jgi:hypothetical protein